MTSYRAESRGMSKQVEAGLESWLQGGVNKTVCLRSVREHWKMSFVLSLNPKRPDQEQINSNLFSLWLQDINKGSSWGSQAPSQLIIQHRWACRCVYMMCVKSYPPVMNSVIGVCVCVCVRACVCVCVFVWVCGRASQASCEAHTLCLHFNSAFMAPCSSFGTNWWWFNLSAQTHARSAQPRGWQTAHPLSLFSSFLFLPRLCC